MFLQKYYPLEIFHQVNRQLSRWRENEVGKSFIVFVTSEADSPKRPKKATNFDVSANQALDQQRFNAGVFFGLRTMEFAAYSVSLIVQNVQKLLKNTDESHFSFFCISNSLLSYSIKVSFTNIYLRD